MNSYENILASAVAGLPGPDGFAPTASAAAGAFEAIRLAAEAAADTEPDLLAAWMLTAAEAADGRDAMLRAASPRPRHLPVAARPTTGELPGLAQALAGLLDAASHHPHDPARAAAYGQAAACARRIRGLLLGDTT